MSQLNFIHVCEKALITSTSGNLNLVEIFENISTNRLPTAYSFSLVVNFNTTVGQHRGKIIVKQGGEEVEKFESEVESRVGKHTWINNYKNFMFSREGEYIFEVYIDEEYLGSIKINLTVARG